MRVFEIDHDWPAVAAEIVAVQRAGYRVEADLIGFDGIPPLHETVDDVRAVDLTMLGAMDDDGSLAGILGFTRQGDVVDIDRLAVRPDLARRGIGRALVGALHERFATGVRFDVSTGSANAPALALYRSEGYEVLRTEARPGVEMTHLWRVAPIGVDAPLGALATDRLLLAPPTLGDLDELVVLFAKPEVWRYPYGRALDRRESEDFLQGQLAHWDRERFGLWTVRRRTDDRLIGYAGLSVPRFLPEILPAVEVGWRFDPEAWGHGFATEAALAAIDEGFARLGLAEIVSVPQSDNLASVAVCDRLGLPFDRTVEIAATERRGAVTGSLYRMASPS